MGITFLFFVLAFCIVFTLIAQHAPIGPIRYPLLMATVFSIVQKEQGCCWTTALCSLPSLEVSTSSSLPSLGTISQYAKLSCD